MMAESGEQSVWRTGLWLAVPAVQCKRVQTAHNEDTAKD